MSLLALIMWLGAPYAGNSDANADDNATQLQKLSQLIKNQLELFKGLLGGSKVCYDAALISSLYEYVWHTVAKKFRVLTFSLPTLVKGNKKVMYDVQ